MRTALIIAIAENGVIGRDGTLPWKLPADLKRFKQLTEGNAVIMGRKTWESLPTQFRPLPKRVNIVVSGTMEPVIGAYHVVPSLADAFALAEREGAATAFVIGGSSIFKEALGAIDECFITHVHADVTGNVSVPELAHLSDEWKLVEQSDVFPADDMHTYPYSFAHYVRPLRIS